MTQPTELTEYQRPDLACGHPLSEYDPTHGCPTCNAEFLPAPGETITPSLRQRAQRRLYALQTAMEEIRDTPDGVRMSIVRARAEQALAEAFGNAK